MNWKLKALIIWVMSIPALSGFPLGALPAEPLPGIAYGWICYGVLVYVAMVLLLGRRLFKISIIIALLITIPLVVLGGLISLAGLVITGWNSSELADIAVHYVKVSSTMIVVIPLALAMVAVLPFYRLESGILQGSDGVTMARKIVLMFLRVFSHILYFVIPNILEVVREERLLPGWRSGSGAAERAKTPLRQRLKSMTKTLVSIGVESICSAIRFIPLWADEISMLPGKKKSNRMRENDESPQD